MKITKDFTTLLDKDIARTYIDQTFIVYNKNNTIKKTYGFSQSFDIDEIWERMKEKYPNNRMEIEIELKEL